MLDFCLISAVTHRYCQSQNQSISRHFVNGANRDRTGDLLLANVGSGLARAPVLALALTLRVGRPPRLGCRHPRTHDCYFWSSTSTSDTQSFQSPSAAGSIELPSASSSTSPTSGPTWPKPFVRLEYASKNLAIARKP